MSNHIMVRTKDGNDIIHDVSSLYDAVMPSIKALRELVARRKQCNGGLQSTDGRYLRAQEALDKVKDL